LTKQFGWPERIGWISTWKVPCGIAEYTRNLVEEVEAIGGAGSPAYIFCDTRTKAVSDPNQIVVPCWGLGTTDVRQLLKAVLRQPLQALVVQHHPGLLPWPALCKLLNDAQVRDLEISVTLHNTQELVAMEPATQSATIAALGRAKHVFSHTLPDYNRLTQLGLSEKLSLIPHGVSKMRFTQPARRLDSSSAPIIGCFGFFFPHKRVHALIEAFAGVRKVWPKARLRLVNAAFPREDSRNEIARCRDLAANLRVMDSIEWITEFVDESEAIDLLSRCDLIVLPYASTAESASGAIRIALASGTPVAATTVSIFDEADGIVARLEDSSPSGLAESIREILADRDLRLRLQAAAAGWTEIRTWNRMAARLMSVLSSGTGKERFTGASADQQARHPAEKQGGTVAPADSGERAFRHRYSA
jgi:glycosyltransferase involved in cell wall biosynthesis